MGYCTRPEYAQFLRRLRSSGLLVNEGFQLIKFWFSVTRGEQSTRFLIRQIDPVRTWKLSPTDLASLDKWDAYTQAKEDMFLHTDTPEAPWTIVKSNDKKRARLGAIRHVLTTVDYEGKDLEVVGEPDPTIVGRSGRGNVERRGEERAVGRLLTQAYLGALSRLDRRGRGGGSRCAHDFRTRVGRIVAGHGRSLEATRGKKSGGVHDAPAVEARQRAVAGPLAGRAG